VPAVLETAGGKGGFYRAFQGEGMTASGLKYLYERNNPEGHFFDRDTMRNFGVRGGGTVKTVTESGVEEVAVWELYRKRPVMGGLHGFCRYFSKDKGDEMFTVGLKADRFSRG
jgi:hypothetical protein